MKYKANLNGRDAIGNGEVDSSILSGSTTQIIDLSIFFVATFLAPSGENRNGTTA